MLPVTVHAGGACGAFGSHGPGPRVPQSVDPWTLRARRFQPNEAAALYRTMRQDGYWPLSDESGTRGEVPVVEGFPGIVAQLGRDWDGPSERVYYWDGQAVRWVARAA